jgi:opacity protein-like surface antigen
MLTMFMRETLFAPLWPARTPVLPGISRTLEIVAAVAAMGMLVAAAALPNDRDTSPAAASTNPPASTARAPGREADFGAYLGAPYHYPSDFHLVKPGVNDFTIKNVNWFTKPFENPLYYGVRYQRWLEGGLFGSMLDFTHSKAYAPMQEDKTFEGTLDGKPAPATAKVHDYFDKLEYSHGHNMLTLNGLVRLPSLGIVSPYAGIGAGLSFPHAEIHFRKDPSRTYEYQFTGPCAQALFGLEFRLRTGSIFVEYKFTFADYWGPLTGRDGTWFPIDMWRQFSRWWTGAPTRDGWAGTRLASHQVIGGFLMRFVPNKAAAP